jgi:uncharacterized DUF497 family protein
MNFVWDPRKSANLARHGIAFEDVVGVFAGPALEQMDDRRSCKRSGDHGDLHGCIRETTPDHFGMDGGTT